MFLVVPIVFTLKNEQLMFDFEIHFIFIESYNYGMLDDGFLKESYFLMSVYNTSCDDFSRPDARVYTWDRNRFSWYVTSAVGAPDLQLNTAAMKYCYIAF